MNKEKIAAIVSFLVLITGFIDTSFDLLQSVGLPVYLINIVKLSGLALTVFLPSMAKLLPKKIK